MVLGGWGKEEREREGKGEREGDRCLERVCLGVWRKGEEFCDCSSWLDPLSEDAASRE